MAGKIDITGAPDISKSRDQLAFHKWIDQADPGGVVVYHIGEHCGGMFKVQAIAMAEAGLISLAQVRHDGKFAYVAIKHRKVER